MLRTEEMRRRSFVPSLAALTVVAASACHPEVPTPPLTGQSTAALSAVPYPPPPARVEALPPRPKDRDAVWLDGEWTWEARRWAWKPGRWVHPPPGARFAPWTTVRDETGTLYFASGTWKNRTGSIVEEPAPIAVGEPEPTAIVTPEGHDVPAGPIAPLESARDGGTLAREAGTGET